MKIFIVGISGETGFRLARLLKEQNFTLRYGPEGKLRKITLLGGPVALAVLIRALTTILPTDPE